MDQWRAAAAAVSHLSQQGVQGGGQYSYSSNSYAGQQQGASQPSAASGAYNPQYLPQVVAPGYGNSSAYAGGNTQQLWSQRQTQSTDQQTQYNGRLGVGGTLGGAAASANQYAAQYGVYGAVAQQQLLGVGVSSKGVVSASDYQASGGGARATSYVGAAAQDNRNTGSGAASYVPAAVSSSVSVSGVYGGGADSSKYVPSAGYAASGLTATTGLQYNTSSSHKADQQHQYASYAVGGASAFGVDQLQQLQGDGRYQYQQQAGGYQPAYREADNSGLLGSLGGSFNAGQNSVYANRGMVSTSQSVYPASPSVGYGGVSLPPGRDYGTGRVSGGGTLFQREGSYGRSDRPSIGSSRFEDRLRDRDGDRRAFREQERERELRERELEHEREREREKERERERRDRDREKERERREEERRNRSPTAKTRRDSPKRDEKRKEGSPRRESSHRHSSPSKEKRREYICKVDGCNVLEAERDYGSISRRYSKLYINPEFSKLVACWMGKESTIMLDKPVSFEHESVDVEDEVIVEAKANFSKPHDKPAKGTTVWNARVMLLSGLTEECTSELLSEKNSDKPPNFHKMLKFIALRRDRSAIMPPGGRWEKALDGGDPATDEGALVRTAVRTLKEYVQVDLSECKDWVRIAEIHYDRTDSDGFSSYKEITVFLLPKLSDCLPSLEDWHLQWNLRKQAKLDRDATKKDNGDEKKDIDEDVSENEARDVNPDEEADAIQEDGKEDVKEKERDSKEEEPPAQPGFILLTKRTKTTKIRSMTISLDGLLDYDDNDRDESSFELSLFSEVFAEMLQYRMGCQILESLEKLRKHGYTRKREEKKRRAESEKEDAKRMKTEQKADHASKPVQTANALKPEQTINSNQAVIPEQTEHEQNEQPPASFDDPKPEEKPESKDSQPTTGDHRVLTGMEVPVKADVPVEAKDETSKEKKNGSSKKDKDSSSKKKKSVVDKELLKAYRYFDRNKVGYLKAEDLRKLLHSLGRFLSPKVVKDLTSFAVSESGRSRDERVVYRSLTEKEVAP